MSRQRALLAASFAACILSIVAMTPPHAATAQVAAAAGKAGGQKTSSTNATATLHDYDALGTNLMLLRSDDYNGSGQATYTSSSSRTSSLSSGFDANGEWNLNLSNQSL